MNEVAVVDVTGVAPQSDDYVVELTFSDGVTRRVDVWPHLRGPVFELVRDPEYFRQVSIDPLSGTICWPNGADIDPLVLRYGHERLAREFADEIQEMLGPLTSATDMLLEAERAAKRALREDAPADVAALREVTAKLDQWSREATVVVAGLGAAGAAVAVVLARTTVGLKELVAVLTQTAIAAGTKQLSTTKGARATKTVRAGKKTVAVKKATAKKAVAAKKSAKPVPGAANRKR